MAAAIKTPRVGRIIRTASPRIVPLACAEPLWGAALGTANPERMRVIRPEPPQTSRAAPVRRIHAAVDAHNLVTDDRGIGRYARAVLVQALGDPNFRFTLVVRKLFPRAAPISRVLENADVTVKSRVPEDADVVWFPWNGTFLGSDAPAVATVHDATPFAYPSASARTREAEQGPFLRTAATAKRILVQSHFTASEVERWLGVPREKIVVTPLAADPRVFAPGPAGGLPRGVGPEPYLIYVGAHDERKNTATLFEAYARAFPSGTPRLVVTRRPAAAPPGVIVVDDCSDAELVALYRGALFVVAPSPYEGFGLPVLEAMSCGAPVLAAHGGALAEIGGDAVGWVYEPMQIEAWVEALGALAIDGTERARLALAGPPHAATFSWSRCATETLAVLRDVAEGV
jgi:glycosyltransferase involved in cell wall biosynthesis